MWRKMWVKKSHAKNIHEKIKVFMKKKRKNIIYGLGRRLDMKDGNRDKQAGGKKYYEGGRKVGTERGREIWGTWSRGEKEWGEKGRQSLITVISERGEGEMRRGSEGVKRLRGYRTKRRKKFEARVNKG